MADDFSISYSFETGTPQAAPTPATPAPAAQDERLYAAGDLRRIDLPQGGTLLMDTAAGRQMVAAPEVALALNACRSYLTLREHAEVLAARIPELAGQQAEVLQVLSAVREAGLLSTAESVCARIGPVAGRVESSPAATRVFIITCDRPAAVRRLLGSLLHTGQLAQHEQLVLVDDSRDPANAGRNREAVREFNRSSPRAMAYLGAAAQAGILEALVAALPEHTEGIRFLVDRERWRDHKSFGLSRTWCLLLSVGARALVMDDDVLCAAIAPPLAGSEVLFASRGRDLEFYDSERDLVSRTRRLDFDPLSGHAGCLGRTLPGALQQLGIGTLRPEHLSGSDAAYLGLWGAQSPVLVTQSGTAGDPGTSGTAWLHTLGGANAERMLARPGGLEAARRQRYYWMGQPSPTFGKLAVISQLTGLDNSHLLPPYFPVFRGEDYLFGAMLEYLHPHAATLDYPWAVPHLPLEARGGGDEPPAEQARVGFNPGKFITDRTVYQPGIPAETRLGSLASLVRELAQTSDSGLLALYRGEAAEVLATRAGKLSATLADGLARSPAWQSWLQAALAEVNQALLEPVGPGAMPGLPVGMEESAVLAAFREYAAAFALSLEAWPAVRSVAPDIVQRQLDAGVLAP